MSHRRVCGEQCMNKNLLAESHIFRVFTGPQRMGPEASSDIKDHWFLGHKDSLQKQGASVYANRLISNQPVTSPMYLRPLPQREPHISAIVFLLSHLAPYILGAILMVPEKSKLKGNVKEKSLSSRPTSLWASCRT